MTREFADGMGIAVAHRTVSRVKESEERESWGDVCERVALGSSLLAPEDDQETERGEMEKHMKSGVILMSGRSLQHGDDGQPSRPQAAFSNCSATGTSYKMFELLLNGSGVGRCYDNDIMVVDWSKQPLIEHVISADHADVLSGEISGLSDKPSKGAYVHIVEDSREGWAQALELLERLTFLKKESMTVCFDWSDVRPKGSPIAGMQNRPSSGPGATIEAFNKVNSLRGLQGKPRWWLTMHVDHYIAECVVVGGARRASRMSTKFWKDSGAFDFCSIKNDAGLWSSNNSIAVDEEFWQLVSQPLTGGAGHFELRAHEIMQFAVKQAYDNRTGEPGFINVDQLRFVKHELPNVEKDPLNTMLRMQYNRKKYQAIVNPCGEISFSMLGAVCIIGDAVPYHAETIDEAEDAIRCMTRALIRLNTMENLAFPEEVKRTNRIGVGLTGIHEFAWDEFGYGFKDLINEEKSQDFWDTIKRLSLAVRDEANLYSARLGISAPHTCVTMKPSGCTTLDTTVICEDGTRTMADIFAEHGYESIVQGDMTNAEIGWLKVNPEAKFMVRDENDDLQRITGLYINGVMPTFEIEFEDGNSYRFTGDHKLKTLNGWKRVDELTESDEIVSYPVSDDV